MTNKPTMLNTREAIEFGFVGENFYIHLPAEEKSIWGHKGGTKIVSGKTGNVLDLEGCGSMMGKDFFRDLGKDFKKRGYYIRYLLRGVYDGKHIYVILSKPT